MCPQSHSTVVTTVVHKMRDGQVFKVLKYLPHTLGAWQLSFSSKMFPHWTRCHHTFPWTDERRANGVVNPLNSLFQHQHWHFASLSLVYRRYNWNQLTLVQSMEKVAIQNRLSPLILTNWKLWNKCWFVGMYTRWGKGYNELHDICLFRKKTKMFVGEWQINCWKVWREI